MHISEEKIQQDIQKISTHRDKNERLSWKRKKDKIEGMVEALEPLEEQIRELLRQKEEQYKEIEALRYEMVRECVHPKDHLVHYGTHVECKWCNAKIAVVR